MKENVISLLTWLLSITLIELGISMVILDSAFRGEFRELPYVALLLAIVFPILILGTFKTMPKFATSICLVTAILCFAYFISYHGLTIIDSKLILLPIGFLVVMYLQGKLILNSK
jgi:hypothetical protein